MTDAEKVNEGIAKEIHQKLAESEWRNFPDLIGWIKEALTAKDTLYESKIKELEEQLTRLLPNQAFAMGDDGNVRMVECGNCKELEAEIKGMREYCMITFGDSHPEMKKCVHEHKIEELEDKLATEKKCHLENIRIAKEANRELEAKIAKLKIMVAQHGYPNIPEIEPCKPCQEVLDEVNRDGN